MNDKATITTQQLVTVKLEGYEPIENLLKKSEWNGMWELQALKGGKVIVMAEAEPFGGLFSSIFTPEKPREVRIVAISPGLLVAIKKETTHAQ